MFSVLLAEKSHRANYVNYFPSICVFNLTFNQSLNFFSLNFSFAKRSIAEPFTFSSFFALFRCQDAKLFMSKRQIWVIFVAIRKFLTCDLRFPDCFKLFARKLRFIGLYFRKAYFNCNFCQGHVILCDKNNFGTIFFALSPSVLLCLHFTLCHARRPKGFSILIARQRFNLPR